MSLIAQFLTIYLLAGVLTSCKKDVNDNDRATTVTETTVTGVGQPESVIDPVTGVLVPAAAQTVTLNAVGELDLRPEAAKTAGAPTTDATLDPRAFTVSGTYAPGGGIPSRGVLQSQIGVASDGKGALPARCANALPAPGTTATTGLAVDGTLTDWTAGAVYGIDRAGDVELSDVDLRELYFASDDDDLYLAARTASAWDTVYAGQKELVVEFRQLNMPAGGGGNPWTGTTLRYYVRGTGLADNNGNAVAQGTGGGQTDYTLAVSGTGIEFRIARSVVEATTGGTYAVNVYTRDHSHNSDTDRVAPYLVGIAHSYACLLPVPSSGGANDAYKLVVLRRFGTTTPTQAEVAFRAFLAAIQAVDFVAQDHFADDTLVLTVAPFSNGWSIDTNAGWFLDEGSIDFLNDASSALHYFHLAAQLYTYALATYDYDLPTSWAREGYMMWMTSKAVASYFGGTAGMFLRNYDLRRMLEDEASNPDDVPLIDPDHWGDAPFSGAYYDRKAAAYFELVTRRLDYSELRDSVFHEGRNGWPMADTDDVVHQIMDRHSYRGAESDDLKSGWFQEAATSATLPATNFADVDRDGLFAFQETEAGTLDTAIDTDRDGISDAMEVMLGLSPTSGQGLGTLVVDNYLGDWELLAPARLAPPTGPTVGTETQCGQHTTITRMGAAFVEGWLMLPIELMTAPTSDQGVSLFVTIDLATGTDPVYYVPWGQQYTTVVAGPGWAFRNPAPFIGRTLELAINASNLGFADGAWPVGATVQVDVNATGAVSSCMTTQAITPITSLP